MFVFALAAAIQAGTSDPSRSALQYASGSLQGKEQCVDFSWVSDDISTPKAAISIPVMVNGKSVPLQLDTASDATIIYGHEAVSAGWAISGEKYFRATSFSIGSTAVDRPAVYLDENMEPDVRLIGTLGLPELMGRIAVIDYHQQRFCLFSEADLPAQLESAIFVRAELRNSKFFVPISVDAFHSDAVIFDTGSSLMPLSVDLSTWKKLTGLAAVAQAPTAIKGTAWGKSVTLSGAPAAASMMLGKLDLGRPIVFTDGSQPSPYASWGFRADGTLGNALLWDGMVILDLTAKVRFGFVR